MKVNLTTSGIGAYNDAGTESATSAERADTSRSTPACSPGMSEFKSEVARAQTAEPSGGSLPRQSATMRRLRGLHRALGEISPARSNPDHPPAEDVDATIRAELSDRSATGFESQAPALTRVSLRKPETMRRLHRLRRELGKIRPAPSNPEQARAEIIEAMIRAELTGWTVPELSDPSAMRLEDGSIRIALISHAIVFRTDGGFRIVDLAQNESVYFEMAPTPRVNGR